MRSAIVQSVSLGVRAADATYDPVRNVVYFTEPDSARVAVLGLSTFTFGAPSSPDGQARAWLSKRRHRPGGDTALVALPDTSQLAVLDRLANAVTTTRINGINGGMGLMRVTANRKALLVGRWTRRVCLLRVVERDLATGKDSIRRDVGQMGHVNAAATLWGSPDHTKVLVLSTGARRARTSTTPQATRFSSCSSFSFNPAAPATATTHGDKWLVGSSLVDGSLNPLATVGIAVPECHLTDRSRMSRRRTATTRSRCPRAHCSNACASRRWAMLPRSE